MATTWEYKAVSAFVSARDLETPARVIAVVTEQWLSRLNKLGADGWELVSEIQTESPDRPGQSYWFARSGTMKRPRQS